MSQSSATQNRKINLRRPDVMQEVQAQVVSHYRSQLVEYMRSNGNRLHIPGQLTIRLAKQFGFCYGVERAIDLAYAARKVFAHPRRIILLGKSSTIQKSMSKSRPWESRLCLADLPMKNFQD